MITKLRIRNFKGWNDTGELKLAPITIFFGTNSSGKSSLGQFLMMLKQTAASHDRSQVLHPGDVNTPVDLGTFDDLLHHHQTEAPLEFEIRIDPVEKLTIHDALQNKSFTGNALDFACAIRFSRGKGIFASVDHFEYQLYSDDDSFEMSARLQMGAGKYELLTKGFDARRKQQRVWKLPPPSRFFGFPDEVQAYYQNTADLEELSLRLSKTLGKIAYLGPLREEPRRFYQWASETPEEVGTRGERWVSALLAASNRMLSRGYKQRRKSFEQIVAEWLRELGLIHSFEVKAMVEGSREYRVRVKLSSAAPEVSIPDVGFGVSQALPVIVQSFYAPKNSTVIIEQPELHLHPAVQQKLADLFIGASQARENGEERNIQFLIESHSEHFLRRLQRRIAEGRIENDRVAIYFCDHIGKNSSIKPIEVDEYGNIKNWPENFFGDQMTDIAEMQKAGIHRRNRINADD
jgi:predicted ATPase